MMIKISTIFVALLVLAIPVFTETAEASEEWPLNRKIDLSSGFGDFRDGHFHAGIDLRTGGKEGASVTSPVDGYVWRVKMSYKGYGKGLYIMGDNGYLYVFGHLSKFSKKIDKPVKLSQIAAKRYSLDLYYPKDSIRVSKGEFLAYTGQSGAGGPHLHFEKRAANNIPVNPLTHGFELSDKVRPTFTRVGFQMSDDRSLLDNGRRRQFVDVITGADRGQYVLDTMPYFNRPFSILVDCYDMMRSGGMKQTIHHLTLFIDDERFYEVCYDSLDFETTNSVRLDYDYVEAVDDRKRVRCMFNNTGNSFSGSRAFGKHGGVFGLQGTEKIGLHKVRLVGEDCFGNIGELTFKFLWGPQENIFDLDSVITLPADTTIFFFTPIAEYEQLGIDSIRVFRNRKTVWGEPSNLNLYPLDNNRFKCVVVGYGVKSAVLRLFLFTANNGVICDNLFNGIQDKQADRCRVEHEVVDDGLLVMIICDNKRGSLSRIELYNGDTLLGTEYPRYFNMKEHICFIPPQPKYHHIDRIGVAMTRDTAHEITIFSDSMNIILVGHKDEQDIELDSFFGLHFTRDNFYQPRFIELIKNNPRFRYQMQLNSAHYKILPEAFVCRQNFVVSFLAANLKVNDLQSGICWLDKKEDSWVWLDNKLDEYTLKAESHGGGSFAAVFDYNPPKIKNLNISDGRTYNDFTPIIRFIIEDTVSGIEDDRNIIIKLDGKWLIPEYDPETNRCFAQPMEPLKAGKHHLGIMITDRVGNLTEYYLNFFIKGKKGSKKH